MGTQEAFHWQAGKKGTATLEDMHAAGVSIRDHPSGPQKGTLLLYNATKAAHEQILPDDWVVRDGDGWGRANAAVIEMLGQVLAPEREALPGLTDLHFERVGFRRTTASAPDFYEHRYHGLTVAEMNEGGWEPLYVATSPERATVADSGDG